jgi:Uma2 family endonuclease
LRDANEHGAAKLEYVDREIYAMAGGTPAHAVLSLRVGALLDGQLRGSCTVASSDLNIHVEATALSTYPDASVICGPIETKAGDAKAVVNPTLLVEVLSDSTEDYDRGDKLRDYKLIPSLQAVWFVSQYRPEITVVERIVGGWQERTYAAGATIALESPRAQLRVDDVYEGVALTARIAVL